VSRSFEYRIGAVVGRGKTKTAAREAAEAECALILDRASDAFRPIIITYSSETYSETYVVVRSPNGWDRYRMGDARPWPLQSSTLSLCRAEVEAQLRLYMAESSWSIDDDPDTHPLLEEMPEAWDRYYTEFHDWTRFQLAFAFYLSQLIAKGYSKAEADHLAHGLALKGPHVKAPEAYGLEPYKEVA
jgi:hypothetical protein